MQNTETSVKYQMDLEGHVRGAQDSFLPQAGGSVTIANSDWAEGKEKKKM